VTEIYKNGKAKKTESENPKTKKLDVRLMEYEYAR